MVVGNELGICPSCTLVIVAGERPRWRVWLRYRFPQEKVLSQLMDALDYIKSKGRQGKAVINMNFVYELNNKLPDRFFRLFRDLLQKLDAENVVLVAAADEGIPVNKHPAKFADPSDKYGGLPNLMVVSASNFKTQLGWFSHWSPYIAAFAPGENVQLPRDPSFGGKPMRTDDGTSFAAPQVAALAAYFRALSSPWQSQLSSPSNVKKLIQLFARRFAVRHHPVATEDMRPGKEDWANVCPTIKDDLVYELPNPGESVGSCSSGQTGSSAKRRRQSAGDNGGSCPHVPGSSGPSKTIDWEEGPSAPECAAADHCGGELCKGYYCDPDPEIPHPPDYYDPKDPENPHGQPAPPLEEPEPTSTTTSTPPTEIPDPPVDTVVVCVGRTIEASWVSEYTSFGHAVYSKVDAPSSGGKGIGIGSINNFPEICDVADDEETADICDFEMTFVNRGPKFWGKCGFQISIDGKQYTPRELDPENENNFCSVQVEYCAYPPSFPCQEMSPEMNHKSTKRKPNQRC
ncbi:peptidase S8/S53 domain-containing protein [Aspergillus pseudodeflectus]|uniref:Peptidase S8/S53 domain-containing protein n=1 Tax=Aspergillus pseudodeflectus TaxID=176178 RepID=A0ABR4J8S0_9EURO